MRFGNLTGSGTGVPGQTLNVPLTVAYNFNIGTSADNPQLDSSLAEFGIIISANVSGRPVPGPTGWDNVVEIVTNGQVLQNSGTANLLLSLPPSTSNFLSVTDLDVQLFIDGAANSVVVPIVPAAEPPEFGPLSVPEPASVWLFASGLFGLLSASMLTRRPHQSGCRRR